MSKKLEEYVVTVPAQARGFQAFVVKASSPKDAIKRVKSNSGKFDSEGLEVVELDWDGAEANINE